MSTSAHNLLAPEAPRPVASFPARTVSPQGLGWTDDRVVLLTALWLEGLSAAAVARRLGGVRRNAVIGKVRMRMAPPTTCTAGPSRLWRRRSRRRVGLGDVIGRRVHS